RAEADVAHGLECGETIEGERHLVPVEAIRDIDGPAVDVGCRAAYLDVIDEGSNDCAVIDVAVAGCPVHLHRLHGRHGQGHFGRSKASVNHGFGRDPIVDGEG